MRHTQLNSRPCVDTLIITIQFLQLHFKKKKKKRFGSYPQERQMLKWINFSNHSNYAIKKLHLPRPKMLLGDSQLPCLEESRKAAWRRYTRLSQKEEEASEKVTARQMSQGE